MSTGYVAGSPIGTRRINIRVVVAGDAGTGKTSVIAAAATEKFPETVPPVLHPTHLPVPRTSFPADFSFYPDGVFLTFIDTASSLEGKAKLEDELKLANVVFLTFACDKPETFDRLHTFWLQELGRLEVKVPVIVVGCKSDLNDEQQFNMWRDESLQPLLQQHTQIECWIMCSATNILTVRTLFHAAHKAVLHPITPLVDKEALHLKSRCEAAFKRIFVLSDHDQDSTLNHHEFNELLEVTDTELEELKSKVMEQQPDGVNEHGLTLTGFLCAQGIYIRHGWHDDYTWPLLRKFGYNDDIELQKENIPVPSEKEPDQSIELTSDAVDYLMMVFSVLENHAPQVSALEDLFSTAPESPWDEAPYQQSVERNELGDMELSGFLSQWALMTLLDPAKSLACLIYIGYTHKNPATALRVTRKRTLDVKKQQSDRKVFQCFVFGPKNAGKSTLLSSFVGRPLQDSSSNQSYTVNAVDHSMGTKTLILREIQEEDVNQLLSSKESLAACDVAVFVYDSSDGYSFKRASELLKDVAQRGDDTGYGVPCLFIAAKADLDSYPEGIGDSKVICQEMEMEEPIRVSVKRGDLHNIFWKIVNAAECSSSIPETRYGRKKKQYRRRLVNQCLMFAVGAATVVTALVAYPAYDALWKSH